MYVYFLFSDSLPPLNVLKWITHLESIGSRKWGNRKSWLFNGSQMVLPGTCGATRSRAEALGNWGKQVRPALLTPQPWTSSSIFFSVIFALLFYLWIGMKESVNLKVLMQMSVLASSLSLDHRLLHPKGLAQLRLDNWVSLMLIGWCANMQTISTVINSLNLFKQLCTSLLNVGSFLCSHFLKKWCPGPPRINVKYIPSVSL